MSLIRTKTVPYELDFMRPKSDWLAAALLIEVKIFFNQRLKNNLVFLMSIGDVAPLDVDALLNRSKGSPSEGSPTHSGAAAAAGTTPTRVLSDAEKMRKVICELVDTEHTYVRHLGMLNID